MNISKHKFYKDIIRKVAIEFDIPEQLVYDILTDIFNNVINVINNYKNYLLSNPYYSIYLPVLGKLTVTLKGQMIQDIIQEKKIKLQEELIANGNEGKVVMLKNKNGYLKFRIKAKEHKDKLKQFQNDSEL